MADNISWTAKEQAAINRQAAQDTATFGNVPTFTPYGSVQYEGTPGQADYRRVEQLDPLGQQAFAAFRSGQTLAAEQGAHRLWDFNERRGPFDLAALGPRGSVLQSSHLPGMGAALNTQALPGMGTVLNPALLPGMADAGRGQTGSIAAVEKATFDRGANLLNPVFQQRRNQLRSQLANQGITGGAAGRQATGGIERQENQAYNDLALAAVGAGRQEHSRLYQMQEAQRAQEAGLQNQGFQQAQALRAQEAGLQGQQFQQQQGLRAQEAGLQGQQFQQAEASRQNMLNQQLAARTQEMSELGNFINWGNPGLPQSGPPAQPQVQPANLLGAQTQQNIQGTYDGRKWWNLLGNVVGAGAAIGASALSERKLKRDVKPVGKVYSYRYKTDPKDMPPRIGVMADEVEKYLPQAVSKGADGNRRVNFAALAAAMALPPQQNMEARA